MRLAAGTWPDGKRCAVSLTFDFDAEELWIGEDPDNASRPGVLSQGTYGAKVGVPLILQLLERRGLTVTFFVPGRVAERYPQRVKEIVQAGHEVSLHGYTHRGPSRFSGAEQEAEELDRSIEVLRLLGAEPLGFRSPAWDFSDQTLELLSERGLLYSSNMMDDLEPYKHEPSGIIELPVQWILDDAPHFMFDNSSWEKTIRSPREVREIWEGEFEAMYDLGALFVLTLHPQLIGRPGRLKMLDEFIDFLAAHEGVWFATCRQVAERFLARSITES